MTGAALQVLEWTQTILAAGEAFCGSESATLRDALRRQSGRFFAAFHSANLQASPKPLPPALLLISGLCYKQCAGNLGILSARSAKLCAAQILIC